MSEKVVPTELIIEESEVIKRYPVTEAIEIVRCRTAIFFHSTCFWVVSRPTMANNMKGGALFEQLQWYCDYQDNREEYPEDERWKYDVICEMMVNLFTLPLDVFTDADFFLDVSNRILEERNKFYDRLTKEAETPHEDTLEDALDNAAFEAQVRVFEEIDKELKDIARKDASERGTN